MWDNFDLSSLVEDFDFDFASLFGGGDDLEAMLDQFQPEWGWTPTTTDGSGNWNFNDIGAWFPDLPGLGGGSNGGTKPPSGEPTDNWDPNVMGDPSRYGLKPPGTPNTGLSDLLRLLGIGSAIGGGVNQNNSIREALDAMSQANKDAQALIQGQLDKNQGRFDPWSKPGAGAVAQLSAMPAANLADRYKPLGSGRGMSLGALARGVAR